MGLFGIDSTKQESTVNDQKVSLNNGGFGASASNLYGNTITYGDSDVAKKALETANAQSNVALESTYYTLAALRDFQQSALHTVDSAVSASQGIAASAAPVSPGNYAEATAGQASKTIVAVTVIIGLVLIFRKKTL